MVSNVKLAQSHLRLSEIFGIDSDQEITFGNINMELNGNKI